MSLADRAPVPPPPETPLVDASGRMSAPWYEYFRRLSIWFEKVRAAL